MQKMNADSTARDQTTINVQTDYCIQQSQMNRAVLHFEGIGSSDEVKAASPSFAEADLTAKVR